MGVFNRFFRKAEMAAIYDALDDFQRGCEDDIEAGFQIVKARVQDFIRFNSDAIQKGILASGVSAEDAALSFVRNQSGELLVSGNHHVQRGLLDEQGQSILKVFRVSTDEMVARGRVTPEWAEGQELNMEMQIADEG